MAVLHKETIHLDHGDHKLTALVMRPDSQEPLPGVVLIQEWWGIEPHIQDLAQRLASEGFVVLVPDLYHGKVVTEPDEAGKAVMMLRSQMDRALGEIRLALDTLKARPDVEPKRVGIVGFCVGGLLTWLTTLHSPDLAAAVPFYPGGFNPTEAQIAGLQVPVLAIFGKQDGSVPAEVVHNIDQWMTAHQKEGEVLVYDAGHAFMNPDHGMGDEASAQAAWPRMVQFLQSHIAKS